jgi:hypothetical protein
MQLDPVDQFHVELFKQVLEMIKQLNYPIIQQAQKVNQTKKPLKNQNGCLSTHKKGLIESTEKAQDLIMFSVVFCESSENRQIGHKTIRKKMSYVSRGGFKLKKGLKAFNVR